MTAGNDINNGLLGELSRQAAQVSTTALALPRRIEDTLDKLDRGDVRVRVRASETDRLLRRSIGMQMTTNYALMASAFTVCATILLVNGIKWLALLAAIVAGLMGVALIRLLMRLNKYDRSL